MNFKEIKELIQIVAAETSLEELEVERSGVRVKIKRASQEGSRPAASADASDSAPVNEPPLASVASAEPSGEEPGLKYVTSPIVGTFYRAPSPDVDPFVSVGDIVEKGSTVCIIEAMKLMNEIETECSGEVLSVFVGNGHPVEYGERLFAIRPR